MQERTRLRDTTLSESRALINQLLFWAIAVLPIIGALGYVLPAHRVNDEAHFHSNYADGGVAPLIAFAAVSLIALALRRRRLGARMVTGVVAMGGAFLALLPVILVHMFSRVENGPGEGLFAVGILGVFFMGLAALIAEPVLYILERRKLERDAEPQIPHARVVNA